MLWRCPSRQPGLGSLRRCRERSGTSSAECYAFKQLIGNFLAGNSESLLGFPTMSRWSIFLYRVTGNASQGCVSCRSSYIHYSQGIIPRGRYATGCVVAGAIVSSLPALAEKDPDAAAWAAAVGAAARQQAREASRVAAAATAAAATSAARCCSRTIGEWMPASLPKALTASATAAIETATAAVASAQEAGSAAAAAVLSPEGGSATAKQAAKAIKTVVE
jgi:hypothetical protein